MKRNVEYLYLLTKLLQSTKTKSHSNSNLDHFKKKQNIFIVSPYSFQPQIFVEQQLSFPQHITSDNILTFVLKQKKYKIIQDQNNFQSVMKLKNNELNQIKQFPYLIR
ncbi:unnamed protein product [Paramecium sonneborni]|uniref:Uncharacterized protein n=1 Tax=Paramecium sonneborni TaxID=65129 RepID=A0A8S1Q0I1_9CILI|nr:unnamed protein product [Paramecium sonneborni]